MTNSNENTTQFLFLPIVLALLFVVGAAALVWVSQVRTVPEVADEAEAPEPTAAVAAGEQPLAGNPAAGETLFVQTCAACHGPEGEGVPGLGKNLVTSELVADWTDEELIDFIKVGRDPSDPLNTTGIAMPPKGGNPSLDDEDLQDIVSFMRTIHQ